MKTDVTITIERIDYQFFDSITYLNQYFHSMDEENERLLRFFAHVARTHNLQGATILDFGCGPTIYAMISLCRNCAEIHMSDYLDKNLQQIQWWLEGAEQSFNWDPFFQQVLAWESLAENNDGNGMNSVTVPASAVAARAALLRQKVTRLIPSNARFGHPVGCEGFSRYDVLVSSFCLEAVAHDINDWQNLFANMTTMLKPGGMLVFTTLIDSTAYQVGERFLATCSIPKQILLDTLVQAGYESSSIELHEMEETMSGRSYQGFAMLTGRKQSI